MADRNRPRARDQSASAVAQPASCVDSGRMHRFRQVGYGSNHTLRLLRELGQELVDGILEPGKMQKVAMIKRRFEQLGAFEWHERPPQVHLPLHDKKE